MLLSMLFFFNQKCFIFQDSFLGLSDNTRSYTFLVANGFVDIRLLSFGIDNALLQNELVQSIKASRLTYENSLTENERLEENKKNLQKENPAKDSLMTNSADSLYVLEVLLYLFYFPSFIHGPIFLFREFRHQMKLSFASANCTLELKDICKNIVRILLWVLFLEVSLHFLYFSALAYNSALKHLSLWALVAVGQSTGQFFMVKYVIFYGLGGQLGRFDGIVPPPEPRCISWVYSFTDMWKYFDTGLYNFIKVYVYIPLGGSR